MQDPLRHLVDAAVDGDERALADLVRLLQPRVWAVCAALGSAGEVEDLVQDSFVRALRSLPSFRGDCPVEMWIMSIARRVCADHVRRRTRHRAAMAKLVPTSEPVAAHDFGIWDVLAHIDDDRREAFVLTQVVGMSYEEAAMVIGCPIGTVRSRVARARSDLADAVRAADSGS